MPVCEWCLKERTHLVTHHYPVPRHAGGTETVRICPLCHAKIHEGKLFIDLSDCKNEREWQACYYWTLHEIVRHNFPGLWQQGTFVIPFTNIYVLNPPWAIYGLPWRYKQWLKIKTGFFRRELYQHLPMKKQPFWLSMPSKERLNPPVEGFNGRRRRLK